MKIRFCFLGAAFLLIAFGASATRAASSGKQHVPNFVERYVVSTLGQGSASMSSDLEKTSIGVFTLSAGLGFLIYKGFEIGISSDYRVMTQFSDVDPSAGNRRGDFLTPISPYIGYQFKSSFIQAVLISSGTFNLSNKTISGESLAYTQPSGTRFVFVWNNTSTFKPMLYYESVGFSKQTLSGDKLDLNDPLNVQHYGVGLVYYLF